MVIKLYISGISGNKEVKKKQQRVQMILDSKQISYEAIDITEPGKEKDKEFMQQNGKVRESLGKHPLPPQIFNDDDFCGDYEDFDMANEVDELEKFLHIETKDSENGVKSSEDSQSIKSKHSNLEYDPYNYHTLKITWDSVNGVQEQIIVNDESTDENKETEETTKSEVNGETEIAISSQLPSDTNLHTETSSENVPAPEKEEEVPAEENNAEENVEEKTEKENNEQDLEVEEEDTKVEKEVDKPKEEEAEKEEESPQAEEEEEEKEEKEKDEEENKKEESEKEDDNESGRESPQSEKSQDD